MFAPDNREFDGGPSIKEPAVGGEEAEGSEVVLPPNPRNDDEDAREEGIAGVLKEMRRGIQPLLLIQKDMNT
jgi:hypothetical protein